MTYTYYHLRKIHFQTFYLFTPPTDSDLSVTNSEPVLNSVFLSLLQFNLNTKPDSEIGQMITDQPAKLDRDPRAKAISSPGL